MAAGAAMVLAMVLSYLPVLFWIIGEARRQLKAGNSKYS